MLGPLFVAEYTDAPPVWSQSVGTQTLTIHPKDPNAAPYYANVQFVTPTYADLAIYGPESLYADQAARYGLVQCKVSKSNYGSIVAFTKGAPSYADVTVDGLLYRVRTNTVVTVPRIVFDIINQSYNLAATLA